MATQPQDMPRGRSPSTSLTSMFRACARDPTEAIATRLRDMLDIFIQYYEEPREGKHLARETAVQYSRKAEALYYQVLEAVVTEEGRRLEANKLSDVLEHDLIQSSLVACCVEIVVFSHHSAGSFPLVLRIFDIAPYHFYKVIELVLCARKAWPPAVVRHLTGVERRVLESLVWSSESPLWDSIKGPLPTCLQVTPPQYLDVTPPQYPDVTRSRTTPPNLAHHTAGHENESCGEPASSAAPYDWCTSPPAGSLGTPAPASPVRQPQPSSVIVTGQMVAAATVTTNDGQTVTIPVLVQLNGLYLMGQPIPTEQLTSANTRPQCQASAPPPTPAQAPPTTRPQRVSSLSLLMRKVYQLCSRRLQTFCAKLDISEEMRLKIWTCFEHSLVHCTDLMRDGHLDTLLMCAIFVMAKVSGEEMSFKHIMNGFRTPTQASNSVSRDVLASGKHTQTSEKSANRQSTGGGCSSSFATPPPTPPSTRAGGGSRVSRQDQQERRTLIHFYNSVYIKQMCSFSKRYSPSALAMAGAETPPYTPYPVWRTRFPSRLRLSSHHSVYISRLAADTPPNRGPEVLYYINKSPSRYLREINRMIRRVTVDQAPTRRRSRAEEEEDGPPVRRPRREGESAWQRRLREVASEQAQSKAEKQAPHFNRANM